MRLSSTLLSTQWHYIYRLQSPKCPAEWLIAPLFQLSHDKRLACDHTVRKYNWALKLASESQSKVVTRKTTGECEFPGLATHSESWEELSARVLSRCLQYSFPQILFCQPLWLECSSLALSCESYLPILMPILKGIYFQTCYHHSWSNNMHPVNSLSIDCCVPIIQIVKNWHLNWTS